MDNEYNKSYSWSFNFDFLQEQLIKKHLQPKKSDRILEIGCNRGFLLKKFQDKDFDVEGIDYSKEAVNNSVAQNVVQMDATKLKYADNTFDKIYSVHTIEHVHDLDSMMSEIERVLKPNGKLVLIYPSEPFRGFFVIGRAILAHRNPFAARNIHVHKLYPKKLQKIAKYSKLRHAKSVWPAMLLPQFVSIFEKIL